ncbi:hypothetical protein [Flavobacterium gawalongense]|uniref:hypothetical protein n=1 Tax=Flavobacterium gawalongense TaxID=2594432 RepID=UPI00163DD836|nr:hypothetical protein [Flavobacterium gawalongense]
MKQNIQTASFVEKVVMNSAQVANLDFDIILDNEITLQNYCDAIINKIFELPQSELPAFINYQTNLVKEPTFWLNKLEKLIASNEVLFTGKCALSRYNKLFNLIELKRKEVQSSSIKEPVVKTPKKHINAESESRYFSFYEIKNQLENITNDDEKILFLTKEKYIYDQSIIENRNPNIPKYSKQCDREIEQIYALRKLKLDLEQSRKNVFTNQLPFKKMQINCNLNQFIDIHYQFSRELFVDGKSIIDGSVNDLVAIIVNSYLDKDGKEISPETVKTILTPSRTEKRPKPHKRIDIDKML